MTGKGLAKIVFSVQKDIAKRGTLISRASNNCQFSVAILLQIAFRSFTELGYEEINENLGKLAFVQLKGKIIITALLIL